MEYHILILYILSKIFYIQFKFSKWIDNYELASDNSVAETDLMEYHILIL